MTGWVCTIKSGSTRDRQFPRKCREEGPLLRLLTFDLACFYPERPCPSSCQSSCQCQNFPLTLHSSFETFFRLILLIYLQIYICVIVKYATTLSTLRLESRIPKYQKGRNHFSSRCRLRVITSTIPQEVMNST